MSYATAGSESHSREREPTLLRWRQYACTGLIFPPISAVALCASEMDRSLRTSPSRRNRAKYLSGLHVSQQGQTTMIVVKLLAGDHKQAWFESLQRVIAEHRCAYMRMQTCATVGHVLECEHASEPAFVWTRRSKRWDLGTITLIRWRVSDDTQRIMQSNSGAE